MVVFFRRRKVQALGLDAKADDDLVVWMLQVQRERPKGRILRRTAL